MRFPESAAPRPAPGPGWLLHGKSMAQQFKVAQGFVGGGGWVLGGPSGRRPCWDAFWRGCDAVAANPAPGMAVPPQSVCPVSSCIPSSIARLVSLEAAMQEILLVVEEAEDGSFRASAAGAAMPSSATSIPARRHP
jgi:hypothetical protein